MTRVGFEYEVAGNGRAVLHRLHKARAVMNPYLCPYHGCGDECCDHADSEYLFSAQEDCTVDAEFPSRTLAWGSERCEEAFKVMEWAATAGAAHLDKASGMHVHVEKPERGDDEGRVSWRLARIFVKYEQYLHDIARAARPRVRSYNPAWEVINHRFWTEDLDGEQPLSTTVTTTARGGTLDLQRHAKTYEFRIWNAARAAWRMRLAVGLSVGMTLAAADGVTVARTSRKTFLDVVGPYLDDRTVSALLRQHSLTGIQA